MKPPTKSGDLCALPLHCTATTITIRAPHLLITICQWVLLSKNWGLKVTGENPKNNNLIFWEDRGDNFEDNIRLVTRWRETRNFQNERVMH